MPNFDSSRENNSLLNTLLSVDEAERNEMLVGFLRSTVADVIDTKEGEVDPETPLMNLGLDSLMTLEVRNRIEAGLNLSCPANLIWSYPTIRSMAGYIAQELKPRDDGSGHEKRSSAVI